jgi:hypothetical protein
VAGIVNDERFPIKAVERPVSLQFQLFDVTVIHAAVRIQRKFFADLKINRIIVLILGEEECGR